jgi:hypothetical protein
LKSVQSENQEHKKSTDPEFIKVEPCKVLPNGVE